MTAPPVASAGAERVYAVTGMTCGSCAARVLARQDGVAEAWVNFATGQASVLAGPGSSDAALAAAVARIGYHLQPATRSAGPVADLASEQRGWAWRAALAWPLGLAVLVLGLVWPRAGWASYVAWALTTPVQFAAGWPILRSAGVRLRARQANMDTLIALGTLPAAGPLRPDPFGRSGTGSPLGASATAVDGDHGVNQPPGQPIVGTVRAAPRWAASQMKGAGTCGSSDRSRRR